MTAGFCDWLWVGCRTEGGCLAVVVMQEVVGGLGPEATGFEILGVTHLLGKCADVSRLRGAQQFYISV